MSADLFGLHRRKQTVAEALQRTADALNAHAAQHPHWVFAWSGGKDSTAALTTALHLIDVGAVAAPRKITALYADTRMELTPLWWAAYEIRAQLAARGIEVRVVMAPLHRRMLPYMLGRGVPPPNNGTLRWCTRQIKIDPMIAELAALEATEEAVMLTGVRVGESAVRDARISASCSADGAECGQGRYREASGKVQIPTLDPILHWRVCNVWEWLQLYAPNRDYGRWRTRLLSEAYSTDEDSEHHARTGCVGCPLATRDLALDMLIRRPDWAYLAPLQELRPLYRWLREAPQRLRKPGGERRQDGTLASNQNRMGPLTMEARLEGLARVLDIQRRCNEGISPDGHDLSLDIPRRGRPRVDLLNAEEEAFIRGEIAANVWPEKWSGDEPRADLLIESWGEDGSVQPLLWGGA